MRFREVKKIIDENFDQLVFEVETVSAGVKISDYFSLVNAINNIRPLGFIEKEMDNLNQINTPFNIHNKDQVMVMERNTYTTFKDNVQTIINKCVSVRMVIENSLPEQSELSMTIGLPELNSIPDLTDFYKRLSKIFTLFFEEKASEIKIQNYDSGSLWTEVVFGSVVTLGGFGSLVTLCSHLFIKIREHKIAEKQFEELEFDQEIKQTLKQKLLEKALIDIENDVISYLPEQEKENKERVANTSKALLLLFELLDEGTTFEAAIQSNEIIKEHFPTLESLTSLPITSKMKISGEVPKLISQITDDNHE